MKTHPIQARVCRLHGTHDLRVETLDGRACQPGEVLVAMEAGGICGSDLHYFHDGGIGAIRVREPIILGHEISGRVDAVGADVTDLKLGDRVAINPSHACGVCVHCRAGHFQHCVEMAFLGSARTMPHVQGAFRTLMPVKAAQCAKVAPHVSAGEAACAEPLAVCLHARAQAGDLSGKRVLITGAGPIGALCAAVAAEGGAVDIAITDIQDFTLQIARHMGATATFNVADAPQAQALDVLPPFDVVFECAAVPPAIRTALRRVKPRGTIVQVGVTGEVPIPINEVVGKEVRWTGTHRFHPEFHEAVDAINTGRILVKPIITQSYALDDALAAFETASDRAKAVKVQLDFTAA